MMPDNEDAVRVPHGNLPEDAAPASAGPVGTEDTAASRLLAEKDAELASTIDRLKRLQAEFENYRKRSARDIAALRERVADDEICSFLPLFDGLERAFSVYGETKDAAEFVAGVEKIFGQFHQILEQKGLKRICTVGERFDPEFHEALVSLPSDQEKNTVIEELSPGYARAGRTLQPSKVAVSQGPDAEEKEES
ncbi:MAG: nucleotide exchange factor GrpE [Candidatus Bipolaricaulota bacterium]|nr:nucleotide exchange factor GrpE [Candidatus Bipolaricaulota bacterium]